MDALNVATKIKSPPVFVDDVRADNNSSGISRPVPHHGHDIVLKNQGSSFMNHRKLSKYHPLEANPINDVTVISHRSSMFTHRKLPTEHTNLCSNSLFRSRSESNKLNNPQRHHTIIISRNRPPRLNFNFHKISMITLIFMMSVLLDFAPLYAAEQPSFLPSNKPSQSPTKRPSSSPSKRPLSIPSYEPSKSPTKRPSSLPSRRPSSIPSHEPSRSPTKRPSRRPSPIPSHEPSILPSISPTISKEPSVSPSSNPSYSPSSIPSNIPSKLPSSGPTISKEPSVPPSSIPSSSPSHNPSFLPSISPTISKEPSVSPSSNPSHSPSSIPSNIPSKLPSSGPTISKEPSVPPSSIPSSSPSHNPSFLPSSTPSISKEPSSSPSSNPSSMPTNTPSELPSSSPSAVPSKSMEPSSKPSISRIPTNVPSFIPSAYPSSWPSKIPSLYPSDTPSISSSPTSSPSSNPSSMPSKSFNPSSIPSSSPSSLPSSTPSFEPSLSPSATPSTTPTFNPSTTPSSQPSFIDITEETGVYITTFGYSEGAKRFDTNQQKLFTEVMTNYTQFFYSGTSLSNIETTSIFIKQDVGNRRNFRSLVAEERNLAVSFIKFSMAYSSRYTNVENYVVLFRDYLDQNREKVASDLKNVGLPVVSLTNTLLLNDTQKPTKAPTPSPSRSPSALPSSQPSSVPSASPSLTPSFLPSYVPSVSPSSLPSPIPSEEPTQPPTPVPRSNTTIYAAVFSALGAVGVLFFGALCWRRRRPADPDTPQGNRFIGFFSPRSRRDSSPSNIDACSDPVDNTFVISNMENGNIQFPVNNPSDENSGGDVSLEDDSGSLLSTGSSMDDRSSFDEDDGTFNLADEFDRYKDQNLEKMRADVEGALSGADGMMSQALTKALMDDMDEDFGSGNKYATAKSYMDIEASVLCEVNDWLKRKEGAGVDDRKEFLQNTLNNMVTCVRRGFMAPEDGSRIVHESAAMLGLELEEDIPETTLIITGMRKKVSTKDLVGAFKEFGDIEDAAVSPNSRGFGVVRFSSPKSVQRALQRFRTGEIVVQDVAVMIKVLREEAKPSR